MQKMVYWFNGNGSSVNVELAFKAPTLAGMEDYVGGYVEHVRVIMHGIEAHMFVNEMGRSKFATRNEPATMVYFAASRLRGIDPEDKQQKMVQARKIAARLNISPESIVDLGDDGKPLGIYGPAIVLVGFTDEEL